MKINNNKVKGIKKLTLTLSLLLMGIVILSNNIGQASAYSSSFSKAIPYRLCNGGVNGIYWGSGNSYVAGTISYGYGAYVQVNSLRIDWNTWANEYDLYRVLESVKLTICITIAGVNHYREYIIYDPNPDDGLYHSSYEKFGSTTIYPNFRSYALSDGSVKVYVRCYAKCYYYRNGIITQQYTYIGDSTWASVDLGNIYYSSGGGGGGGGGGGPY